MTKERKAVTLDPEVKAYLDAEGRNASETVNKLVKMEMGEGVANEQLLKMRMEMEKDRYEAAASKARGHLDRYNQLKKRLDEQSQKQEEEESEVIKAVASRVKPIEWLSSSPKEQQIPPHTHDPFQNYAGKVDLTAEQLRDAVVDHILTEEADE